MVLLILSILVDFVFALYSYAHAWKGMMYGSDDAPLWIIAAGVSTLVLKQTADQITKKRLEGGQ